MSIAPGSFGAPMLSTMPLAAQDALAASVPFPNRLGTPAEDAKRVKQVIENEMLNGKLIRLDRAIGLAPKQLGVAAKRFQASSTTPGSPFMPRSNVATLSQ